MSFILDALKKSEVERQRQALPSFMGSGAPAARRRFPIWAIALVMLLGINLAVLLIVLTRGGTPSALIAHLAEPKKAAEPPAPAAAPPAPAAAPPASDHFSPLDAAPVYAPEIPAEGGANVVAPVAPPALRAPAAGGVARSHAARTRDPLLTADEDQPNEEMLPSISEINLEGQQALPDLHLDVHVYATKPAERFVYINMRKYREGDTLAEGPILERIRRDGVVLNYHALRFVLPRQQ